MKAAPHKFLTQATLVLALFFTGYTLMPQATPGASAQQQQPTPTPTPKRNTNRRGQADETPTPTPTPTPKSGMSTGTKAAIGGAIAGGILGSILIAKHGGGVSEKDLSKNGPSFPQVLNMSNIKVTGFAHGGWPVFVVYEVPQPASVTLSIKADEVDPFIQQLEGSTGAHEIRLTVPARFGGKKPRVTDFALSAVSNNPNAPVPVELVSVDFSVGPEAVGSSGIDSVSFQPGSVFATAKSEKANYKFHSLFDFDKVTADFMWVGRNDKGEIVAKRVGREKFDKGIKRDGWLDSAWDCREGKKISLGRHQLQVRGWSGLEKTGSWVAVMSKQFVRIQ